jgi:hypothetical protein
VKIAVQKCRFTGKIFEMKDRAKYMAHLKELRAKMKTDRHLAKVNTDFASWLAEEKKKIIDVDMIIPWFLENQRYIMDANNAGIHGSRHSSHDKFYKDDKFENMTLKVDYRQSCSNSHTCPDNGVTNWCSKDNNLPTGYKGWHGHIGGSLKRLPRHNSSYPFSNALNIVGLKTGSGGGGNEHWSYDLNIFLDDWPGLQAAVDIMEQEQIVQRLKGKR